MLDYIRYKQLNWYGYMRRMNGLPPQKILEGCPPGRWRKARHRKSGMQEVTTGMREKGINNMEWIDKEK